MLEVELRGTLTKTQVAALKNRLSTEAVDWHSDDKITYFFVTRGFILKVTQPDEAAEAFITLKIGDETTNVLEELDIRIPSSSVNDALSLLRGLGFDEVNRVAQKRTNYTLGSFELALKHTDDWGYHFELEGSAVSEKEAAGIRGQLQEVCREYDLQPMTPDEIRQKIHAINISHGFKNNL